MGGAAPDLQYLAPYKPKRFARGSSATKVPNIVELKRLRGLSIVVELAPIKMQDTGTNYGKPRRSPRAKVR